MSNGCGAFEPKIALVAVDVLSEFHATPPSAKNATSTGTGPYIRWDAPKGRSSGKRNSTFPTSTRLPTS